MINKVKYLLLLAVFAVNCTGLDDDFGPKGDIVIGDVVSDVYIVNEGTFTWGNASITGLNKADNAVSQQMFNAANGRPLGDVAQSMYIDGDTAYIVVNNSGKIEVVSLPDMKSIKTITGFTSPRYFLPIGVNHDAFVTDLYADKISVVDVETMDIIGIVDLPGWTEEMVVANGRVFVENRTENKINMIRLSDYRVEPYGIPVNGTLSGLAAIGKWIYILSDKELVRMKNTSTSTEVLYTFPPGRAPMRLWADIRTETLYFLDGGVYQFYTGFGATGLPVEVIPLDGRFYGLGVDPANHDIYVADARDFVQPGRILVYNSGFELVRTFESGIVPQHFAFAIE